MPVKKESKSNLWVLLIALIAAIAAVVVLFVLYVLPGGSSITPTLEGGEEIGVETSQYQAVFMTNGQAYFGQIVSDVEDQFVILEDVYYLQVQPTADNTGAQREETSLVKLGSEMHGPEDSMKINRDHILFIEELKSDSKIVGAIQSYQQGD